MSTPSGAYRHPAPMGTVDAHAHARCPVATVVQVPVVSVAPTFETMAALQRSLEVDLPKAVGSLSVAVDLTADVFVVRMVYLDGRRRECHFAAGPLRDRDRYGSFLDVADAIALQALCDRREELL